MSTKRKIIDPRRYLRRWSRRDVRIAADVDILLHNNKKFTSGVAIIRNISLRGALIGGELGEGIYAMTTPSGDRSARFVQPLAGRGEDREFAVHVCRLV